MTATDHSLTKWIDCDEKDRQRFRTCHVQDCWRCCTHVASWSYTSRGGKSLMQHRAYCDFHAGLFAHRHGFTHPEYSQMEFLTWMRLYQAKVEASK